MLTKIKQKKQLSMEMLGKEHLGFEALEERKLKPLVAMMPSLGIMVSDKRKKLLGKKLQNQLYKNLIASIYEVVGEVFLNSNSIDDLRINLAALEKRILQLYEDNMNRIYEQLVELKRTVFSLKLAYDNAQGGKIYLFPVDKNAFLNSPDSAYWDRLVELLEERFYRYDMTDVPMFFSSTIPIEDGATALKIAQTMAKILGIAQIDLPPQETIEELEAMIGSSFDIVSSDDKLAHLMVSGTHGYIKGVYEDYDQTQLLAIPLGPPSMGKMLSTPIGAYFTGLSGSSIIGIKEVSTKYTKERINSAELAKRGVNMILDSGHFVGTVTMCNGNIAEYNSFLTMCVFCAIQRSLLQYANRVAHGTWGKQEQESFINQLLYYFNDQKKEGAIDEPVLRDDILITFDPNTKTVALIIPIKYKGVTDRFEFTLTGKGKFSNVSNKPC